MSDNQEMTKDEIEKIRHIEDFDLIMLINDIHDNGWAMARRTLALMPPMDKQRFKWLQEHTSQTFEPRSWNNLKAYLTEVLRLLNEAETRGLSDTEAAAYASRIINKNKRYFTPEEPDNA